MSGLIYVADADFAMRNDVKHELEKKYFQVECFENCNLLYETFQSKHSDLVILNKSTSESNGFVTSAKIRQHSDLPIIMLTPWESNDDYVIGTPLGIDAFIVKPFSPEKLIAQVKALITRTRLSTVYVPSPSRQDTLMYADVRIHPGKLTCHSNGKVLRLTNTEFNVFIYMLENQDRTISRKELLGKIWSGKRRVGVRATDDTIKRLRKKLAEVESQVFIETVWGYGFKLCTVNSDLSHII